MDQSSPLSPKLTAAERLATSVGQHALSISKASGFRRDYHALVASLESPALPDLADVIPLVPLARRPEDVRRLLSHVGRLVYATAFDWRPWFDLRKAADALMHSQDAAHIIVGCEWLAQVRAAEERAAEVGGFHALLEGLDGAAHQSVKTAFAAYRETRATARKRREGELLAFALKYGLPPDPGFLDRTLFDADGVLASRRELRLRTRRGEWYERVGELLAREDVLPPWTAGSFTTFRRTDVRGVSDFHRYGIGKIARMRYDAPKTAELREVATSRDSLWQLVRSGRWSPFVAGDLVRNVIGRVRATPLIGGSAYGTWCVYLVSGLEPLAAPKDAKLRVRRVALQQHVVGHTSVRDLAILGFELKGSRRRRGDDDQDRERVHADFLEAHRQALNRLLEMQRKARDTTSAKARKSTSR